MMMPFSFGIPLGILIMIGGAILFFSTRYKKPAKLVIVVGVVIAVLTILLIVLAVNSAM